MYIGAGTFSVLFPKRHYPWGVSREDRDWDLVITGSFKPMVFPVEKRVLMVNDVIIEINAHGLRDGKILRAINEYSEYCGLGIRIEEGDGVWWIYGPRGDKRHLFRDGMALMR